MNVVPDRIYQFGNDAMIVFPNPAAAREFAEGLLKYLSGTNDNGKNPGMLPMEIAGIANCYPPTSTLNDVVSLNGNCPQGNSTAWLVVPCGLFCLIEDYLVANEVPLSKFQTCRKEL